MKTTLAGLARSGFVFGLATPWMAGCLSVSGDASDDPSRIATAVTGGSPIPGTIEAESYKAGGEGVGFHDTTPKNLGGACGNDAVDKKQGSDPAGGNCVIGWFQAGEWLAYDVNIAAAGTYDLTLRVARGNPGSGSMHVEIDGKNVSGAVAIASTGSWTTFANVVKKGITLPAGAHTLKVWNDVDFDDFNWFSFVAEAGTAPPPSSSPPPPPPPASCPSSLQSAVNAAPAGATINATGCTFHERVTVNKSMTLEGGTIDATGLGVPLQQGGLSIDAADVTVHHFRVTGSSGAGIHVGGARATVTDSEFDNNTQEGYSVDADDAHFLRDHFHHNNVARTVDPGWEAGGGKAHGARIVFDSCESDNNGGPGIWFDQWYPTPYPANRVFNPGAVVKNCRVHDNQEAGIMYEVSDGATITDNAVWSNGNVSAGWFWAAGILISSSRNVEVARNVLAYNLDGISILSQDRGDQAPGGVVGINVHDNVVVQAADKAADSSDKAMLAFAQDWSSVIFDAASGNVGSANRFWSVYPEPRGGRFSWSSPLDTLAQLNATPIGGGSSYLSTADKDAALAGAGIP